MSVTPLEKSKSIQSTEVDGENIPDCYEYVEPKDLAGKYITSHCTIFQSPKIYTYFKLQTKHLRNQR